MADAWHRRGRGRGPCAGRPIVGLGRRLESLTVESADGEHAAVAQPGRGVAPPRGCHAPGRGPGRVDRIIELRGAQHPAAVGDAPRDQDSTIVE